MCPKLIELLSWNGPTVHVCCFMLARASTKTFVSRIHIRYPESKKKTAKKIFVSRKIRQQGHLLVEVSLYKNCSFLCMFEQPFHIEMRILSIVQPTFGTVLPDDEIWGLKYIAILYSNKQCFYNKLIVLNAVQFWHLFSMALLQGGLMHLRLTRCWPHTKKLHVCEADYFSTCNSDMCLVTVRLIILSCLLECHINIYLSDHML